MKLGTTNVACCKGGVERMKRGAINSDRRPQTIAVSYPPRAADEGMLKSPAYFGSTPTFQSAVEGKRFFELAYGLRSASFQEDPEWVYSRQTNPNIRLFERHLAAWDKTDMAAAFASGMAAISTTLLALLSPGDHVIASAPLSGATHYLLEHILPRFGITCTQVIAGDDTVPCMRAAAESHRGSVRLLLIETPTNPSNIMVDLEAVAALRDELRQKEGEPVHVAVDNTRLGPVFQSPAAFGADLVLYTADHFIGGHDDVVAGIVTGRAELITRIGLMRTILGTVCAPSNGWLLLRSLETLSVRMERQSQSASALAELLHTHPRVTRVHYPHQLLQGSRQRAIFERQCRGPGSLLAFDVEGGEQGAFAVLDAFETAQLATATGGTRTLVEHPQSMTHADIPPEHLEQFGVRPSMIRMSVGLEHIDDLVEDLRRALSVLA